MPSYQLHYSLQGVGLCIQCLATRYLRLQIGHALDFVFVVAEICSIMLEISPIMLALCFLLLIFLVLNFSYDAGMINSSLPVTSEGIM